MTNASLVPTTATSFGLSARATAEGSASVASTTARAILVVMPGLYGYGTFHGLDLSQNEPGSEQQEAGQDRDPEPLAGEWELHRAPCPREHALRSRRCLRLRCGSHVRVTRPVGARRIRLRLRRVLVRRRADRSRRRLGRRRCRPAAAGPCAPTLQRVNLALVAA